MYQPQLTRTHVVIIMLGILAGMWLAGYFVGDYFYSKSDEQLEDEWCVAGEIDNNGTMHYTQQYAGETELLLLATASGPVLMAKCK